MKRSADERFHWNVAYAFAKHIRSHAGDLMIRLGEARGSKIHADEDGPLLKNATYCMAFLAQRVLCASAPESMRSELRDYILTFVAYESHPPDWLGPQGMKGLIVESVSHSAALAFEPSRDSAFFRAWAEAFFEIIPAPGVSNGKERYAEAVLAHYESLQSEHAGAVAKVKADPGKNWLGYAHGLSSNLAKHAGCSVLIAALSTLLAGTIAACAA
jgi:hypothetical protein